MTTTHRQPVEGFDSSRDVLAFARSCRRVADRAEADLLVAAATWAEQHPPESLDHTATWVIGGGDTGLPIAGPGAPLVSEFCLAEFACAVGLSTDSGRTLIATAVELKYRLPRVWAQVAAGRLQAWRARRVAETTLGLTAEAAGFVDAQVAGFAHKIGLAALERLVEEATTRFMPQQARENADRAADGRHVEFHHDHVSFNGTTHLDAELDLADALDLDAAITRGAEQLRLGGSTRSLDVCRAMAAGELARHQLALDLAAAEAGGQEVVSAGSTSEGTGPADPRVRPKIRPRQVVLYVHLSEAAIRGTGTGGVDLARAENHRSGVTADQVRTWCANPHAHVVVHPVIDLAEHIGVEGYEVPERLQQQTELRDHHCVFPWCTRAARRCDHDHVVPFEQGGTTCSCNIAPLCRRHHRVKTHTGWGYVVLEPGSFLWTSPHGYQFLRDHTGTLDVSADKRPRNLHPDEP